MTRLLPTSLALLLLLLRPAIAAEADGPYVIRNATGQLEAWSVQLTAEGARKQVSPAAAGTLVTCSSAPSVATR